MDYMSLVNMGPEESYPVDRSRSIFDLMDERKLVCLLLPSTPNEWAMMLLMQPWHWVSNVSSQSHRQRRVPEPWELLGASEGWLLSTVRRAVEKDHANRRQSKSTSHVPYQWQSIHTYLMRRWWWVRNEGRVVSLQLLRCKGEHPKVQELVSFHLNV